MNSVNGVLIEGQSRLHKGGEVKIVDSGYLSKILRLILPPYRLYHSFSSQLAVIQHIPLMHCFKDSFAMRRY